MCGLGLLGFLIQENHVVKSMFCPSQFGEFEMYVYHLGLALLSDCITAAVLLLREDAILMEETKIGDDRPL